MPREIAVPEKAGETTAIPEPLGLIDMEGDIVVIGALAHRKATAEKIVGKKADWGQALKESRRALCGDAMRHFGGFRAGNEA